jgi:hypothetical protein
MKKKMSTSFFLYSRFNAASSDLYPYLGRANTYTRTFISTEVQSALVAYMHFIQINKYDL